MFELLPGTGANCVITLTTSEIEDLLTKLCVDLGFCLPPSAVLRFKNSPPPDIDSFTDAVFIAEGLDPRSDRKLRAQVRAIVSDRFAVPQSSHTKKVSDSKLHPDFPVAEDNYQMTDEWSLTLPLPFNRRFEEGSLVIWRPRLTFWINVWGNDNRVGLTPKCRDVVRTARRCWWQPISSI